MATIQYIIDDNQLKELLELTGEKAGTKALQAIIKQYKQLRVQHPKLQNEYLQLEKKHRELNNKVKQFGGLLNYFATNLKD